MHFCVCILDCDCNDLGSNSKQCDTNGICFCKPNVIGDKCTTCKANHYGFPDCKGKLNKFAKIFVAVSKEKSL